MAISAPYGGKDQGGVVYIYFGKKDGIETSPRQVSKSVLCIVVVAKVLEALSPVFAALLFHNQTASLL